MIDLSGNEWQRIRSDFELRASEYHDLKLSIYYDFSGKPQLDAKFPKPNHAISLWQHFGHLTGDEFESLESTGFFEPTHFGMTGAVVSAFAIIIGQETGLFCRMAGRAGSLVPDEVGQQITLMVASRFFVENVKGKPFYICNPNPLAKWLNLVLVAIATCQPQRFRDETLAVDPFAASLVALDFLNEHLKHGASAAEPVATTGLIPVALQQLAHEVRSLAVNLHCCNQELPVEQSRIAMERVCEQMLRIEALLPKPIELAACGILARCTLQQLAEWIKVTQPQLAHVTPPFEVPDLSWIYALASKLDRHADDDSQNKSVAPQLTDYQRQQLYEKYGAAVYLRRRGANEPDNTVERINAGMQETLHRFPETRTWLADDWAGLFFCSAGVVRETVAWRKLDPNTSSLSRADQHPLVNEQSAKSGQSQAKWGEEMSNDATREFLMKVGTLKGMLNERARGGSPSERDYSALRSELVNITSIRDALPSFVLTCHTIQEFWLFIKSRFAKYSDRTEFLREEFSPILSWLEGGVAPATSEPTEETLPKPDVVLVTVNKYETRAVLDAFEAATGAEAAAVSIGERVYRNLGTLNGTTVYHAISEMGSGSPGGMQQTVDRAIRSLGPNAVIALGIAFGVDETQQSIGEILLSKQLRLYELQRVGKQRKIVVRGARPDAAPRLVNHFRGFADAKWNGAPVTSGVLLTGEKLVDNIDYRKQLQALEFEAIGGEMEGAGLYVSGYDHKVDWIVVKAICDFADGNKGVDKTARQKLAAKNAAEFVVQALRYAPLKRH